MLSFLSGIWGRFAYYAAFVLAILIAAIVLIFMGRSQAADVLSARVNRARVKSLKTSQEVRDEVRNTDDGDLDRRLDKWMR